MAAMEAVVVIIMLMTYTKETAIIPVAVVDGHTEQIDTRIFCPIVDHLLTRDSSSFILSNQVFIEIL